MKFLILTLVTLILSSSLLASKYEERTYMSVGTLPDNIRIICINNEQWTEETQEDKIILDRIYYHDDEIHEDVPLECDINMNYKTNKTKRITSGN